MPLYLFKQMFDTDTYSITASCQTVRGIQISLIFVSVKKFLKKLFTKDRCPVMLLVAAFFLTVYRRLAVPFIGTA